MPEYNVVFNKSGIPLTFTMVTSNPIPNDRLLSRHEARGYLNGIRVSQVDEFHEHLQWHGMYIPISNYSPLSRNILKISHELATRIRVGLT